MLTIGLVVLFSYLYLNKTKTYDINLEINSDSDIHETIKLTLMNEVLFTSASLSKGYTQINKNIKTPTDSSLVMTIGRKNIIIIGYIDSSYPILDTAITITQKKNTYEIHVVNTDKLNPVDELFIIHDSDI